MCSDENGASHAVRFLNAQLAAQHQNAKQCLEEHPQSREGDNEEFYALAEFKILRPGASSPILSARFGVPILQFICDHDAILSFTIEKDSLTLDGKKIDLSDDLRVSYRVGFITEKDFIADQEVGLMIFDLQNAIVLSCDPPPTDAERSVLLRYLTQYLHLLHRAGNHTLFSLPQFGTHEMKISFLPKAKPTTSQWLEAIYGVSVQTINVYMSSVWFKSAMSAYGLLSTTGSAGDPPSSSCLSEFSHVRQGMSYRIKFNAPCVNALCAQEVCLSLNIDEIEFSKDGAFASGTVQRYTNWKIAFFVDVIPDENAGDHVHRVSFNFASARFDNAHSEFAGIDEEDVTQKEYLHFFREDFVKEYLLVLCQSAYRILYEHDKRWEEIKATISDSHMFIEGSAGLHPAIVDGNGAQPHEGPRHAKMGGFDQIIAISQASMNAQFSTLKTKPSASLLQTWKYQEFFSATFGALSLRLLSNNRAIVWVSLTNGHLKLLRDGVPSAEEQDQNFADWRIAFEVNLQMYAHAKLEGGSSATIRGTKAYETYGKNTAVELNHICLDLRHTVAYVHEYSTYGDINTSSGEEVRAALRKLQAAIHYLTQHYFPALAAEGLNVLTTVPVWKHNASAPSYALTAASFHVYSALDVTRSNWTYVPTGKEPVLVVLGMTRGRPLPASHLDFSSEWVAHAHDGFSHGTLCIARGTFVKERLLALLSGVNARTTLLLRTVNPSLGFRGVTLVQWAEHDLLKDLPSESVLQEDAGSGYLRYKWQRCEVWKYDAQRTGHILDTTEEVTCTTTNYVELPTMVKQGALEIKLSGKVELNITIQTRSADERKASSSVSWSTSVVMQTKETGLEVTTHGSDVPVYADMASVEGAAASSSLTKLLRDAFPHKVPLDALVNEVRAFQGPVTTCYPLTNPYSLTCPAFNDDGDLLFELRRHGAKVKLSKTLALGIPGSPTFTTGRRPRTPNPRTPNASGRSSPVPGLHASTHSGWSQTQSFIKYSIRDT
ncbi:hypothetical protein C8Q77DRAFT_1158855 [Trametes polyzona]|nr:hypothetical protein C8Q77DRAFT_1158855 [Trametes polyzona]